MTCKAKVDNYDDYVRCNRRSGHRRPHRSKPSTWYDEDSNRNLRRRFLEWTKPNGQDAKLRRTQEVRPSDER